MFVVMPGFMRATGVTYEGMRWLALKAGDCFVQLWRLLLLGVGALFSSRKLLEIIEQDLTGDDKYSLLMGGKPSDWEWMDNHLVKLPGERYLSCDDMDVLCSRLRFYQLLPLYRGEEIFCKIQGTERVSLGKICEMLDKDPLLWGTVAHLENYLFPTRKEKLWGGVPSARIEEVIQRIEVKYHEQLFVSWKSLLLHLGMQVELDEQQVVRGPDFLSTTRDDYVCRAAISNALDSAVCFKGLFGPTGRYHWMIKHVLTSLREQTVEVRDSLRLAQQGSDPSHMRYWHQRKAKFNHWNLVAKELGLEEVLLV